MTGASLARIAMIGVADLEDKVNYLYDPMLYHAFMLMSVNLAEATYQVDTFGFHHTPPLHFSFTKSSFIFSKHPTHPGIATLIRDNLLPLSDGVIINLSRSIRADNTVLVSLFNEITYYVHEAKLPTVFVTSSVSRVGNWHPPEFTEVVFRPMPEIMQFIKESFPSPVPILGYDYIKPGSVQNILTTLLAEIEKGQLRPKVRSGA